MFFFFALDIGKWNFCLFSVSEEVWVVNGLCILMASTTSTSTYIILRSAHHHFFVGILIFDLGNFGIHNGYDYVCCYSSWISDRILEPSLSSLSSLIIICTYACRAIYDFKVFRSLRVFRGETFQVSLLARRNRCEARYFPRDFSRESGLVAAVSQASCLTATPICTYMPICISI